MDGVNADPGRRFPDANNRADPTISPGFTTRRLHPMTPAELLSFAAIGCLAGGIGGLLGIGGSAVFIPVATLLFGPDQQVYQAAAMILNAAVAATATAKHHRVGAVPWRHVLPMAIAAVVMVLVGVAAGNALGGAMLARLFGILLLILAFSETRNLLRRGRGTSSSADVDAGRTTREHPAILTSIGGAMGLIGGLLGIGGGTIGVPLLRYAARFPLRACIASSAAVTLPLAVVGAVYKNLSLSELPGESIADERRALIIAAAVVPTAIAGAFAGATLVHRLPLTAIRVAFVALLLIGGARMLLTPEGASQTPPSRGSSLESHVDEAAGSQPAELSATGPAQASPSGTTLP